MPEPQALPLPHGFRPGEAAAIPETFFTVWTNLFDRGKLAEGETVLIHGGSSGIGTTAIQLARAFGATVFATAGSDGKCAACERLGARAINYRAADFVQVIREWTGNTGVDVILDIVGGDYLQRNIDCLAMHGRLIQIGLLGRLARRDQPSARHAEAAHDYRIDVADAERRRERAHRQRPRGEGVAAPRVPAGRAVIDRTLPLSEAAEAHRLLESGEVIGKIVLVP